ncbi:hypothetical protein [Paracoccus sp. (in: a-proteobacteria)]|uniref:hypothetical protein n=1 Tax=Paracoccus sp. TaxID=267 RepID=UPI0028A5BAED|nr:hypothetical protein [Paracoccus sp. (in: a-proteobacteria)]
MNVEILSLDHDESPANARPVQVLTPAEIDIVPVDGGVLIMFLKDEAGNPLWLKASLFLDPQLRIVASDEGSPVPRNYYLLPVDKAVDGATA